MNTQIVAYASIFSLNGYNMVYRLCLYQYFNHNHNHMQNHQRMLRTNLAGLYCGGADLCLDKNLIRSLQAAL